MVENIVTHELLLSNKMLLPTVGDVNFYAIIFFASFLLLSTTNRPSAAMTKEARDIESDIGLEVEEVFTTEPKPMEDNEANGPIILGCIFIGKDGTNLRTMVESLLEYSEDASVHIVVISDGDSWPLAEDTIDTAVKASSSNGVNVTKEFIGKNCCHESFKL